MALQDMDTARELIVTAARTVFGCSLVCALPLLAIPELVLSVFGSEFAASAPALRLLTLGYLAASFVSLADASLSMRGQQRPVVLCLLFGVAVSFALNLVLIPCYGMIGAAAANAISTVVWQAALFLIAYRRLGIWTCPLG
jgi:O-antigen/teichoic acid export membrane protein